MSTHRLIRIIFATLCGLATVVGTEVMRVPVHAAQAPSLVTFDRADFILSDERRPPDNDAAWQPVRLPDQWRHRLPAGTRGQGWYRIRFDLPRDPTSMLEVGITHPRAFRTAFIVNGKSIGGAGDLIAGRHGAREKLDLGLGFGTPLHVTVPPSLLHAGGNVIHVRVNATSSGTFMHGLPQVTLGDAVAMRDVYIARSEAGFSAQRAFFAMALTTGIITFFLWLARRGDRVLFWYSVACLMWGLISVPRIGLRWVEIFLPAIPVLAWFLNYALVVPLIILCLRTVHLKWPRFEAALWVYLALEATFPLWAADSSGPWRLAWDTANTALLLTGVAIIGSHSGRPMRWPVMLQIFALILMAALMFFEVMRYLGWVYVDFKAIRHYHVPLMLLAIGAVIFDRHVNAVRRTAQANQELEQRVAEKTREIEENYARMEEAMREQALARDRQRILADVSDGLGASLIGLLRLVQIKGGDYEDIENRVREALREMKVAVDAFEPHEGNLASVLVGLQHRFDEMFRSSGIQLTWEVGELPHMTAGLSPSSIFALQRILLEATTNILKHSGAQHVTFTVRAYGKNGGTIEIEDDGRGFDPEHARGGLGLTSMRERAARMDASLEILPRPTGGTRIRLSLPDAFSSVAARAAPEVPESGLQPTAVAAVRIGS